MLVLMLAVTGCTATNPLKNLSSKGGEETKELPKIVKVKDSWSKSVEQKELNPALSIVELRMKDQTVLRLKDTEKWLNTRLSRLLKVIPEYTQTPRVYITPSASFIGQTYKDGGIFIPVGVLVQIQNEEEIDAMLAHELSHLLLKHHVNEQIKKVGGRAAEKGSLLKGDGKLFMGIAVFKDTLFGHWGHKNESDADLLAVDLLVAAEINPRALLYVLKKVRKYETETATVVQVQTASLDTSKKRQDDQILSSDIWEKGSVWANKILGVKNGTQKRATKIKEYLREQYPNNPRTGFTESKLSKNTHLKAVFESESNISPLLRDNKLGEASKYGLASISGPLTSNAHTRFVMWQIRSLQGQKKNASTNLDIAFKSKDAPFYIYHTFLRSNDSVNNKENVLSVLKLINAEFGHPDSFIHEEIHYLAKYGKNDEAKKLVLRCAGLGDMTMYDLCTKARDGQLYES